MKQKYIRIPIFYATLASFLLVGTSYATSNKEEVVIPLEVYATQLPTYAPLNSYGSFVIRLDKKTHLTEQEFVAKANEFFGLPETNRFELLDSYTDSSGKLHQTYQHYVGKYAVEGQMFILHKDKNGRVTAVNGTVINIENKKSPYSLRANVNRKPAISSEAAVGIAFKSNQIKAKETLDYPVETVFVKSMSEEGVFVLAHKVRVEEISSTKVVSKQVFVSVENGAVVNEVSLIAHASVPGIGDGHYRNNLPLAVREQNGKYQLFDEDRRVITYDAETMDNQWDFLGGKGPLIENSTTTFPKSPTNDLHWGLMNTYDYYNEVHNRNSFDGRGAAIYAYYNPVFLDNDGSSGLPENAYAMSAGRNSYMVFGRGATFFNPLVTLDVVAHEFTHLVVGSNGRGGLTYQGESGALNEGFADMLGNSVEHYTVDDADWLIGLGVVKGFSFNYMRNMQDPKNNRPGGQQPSTYQGEYWASTSMTAPDAGGVHTNSGVINYWYYLISEGGMGVNDLGNDYVVSGIGLQKAEQIAFQTLMTQLGSNSQYIDVVNGTLSVAMALYGEDSEEYFAVYDAWYAVGFGEVRPNMGIEDFELTEEVFSLYPNPVSNGELTVLIKDERGTIVFYNMAGQKVTQDFPVEKGENKVLIPQLKTGTYIVVYESKERKIAEKIVVK